MKKLLGTVIVLFSTLFISYSQDDNSGDDVYYQDDQVVNTTPTPDQNNDGSDAAAPTYQTFYDQLSPYGSWVDYPGYGYCWVPANQDADFSPYMTNGNWVYTDLGWTWVSDYPWGWGPFHYGRWFQDDTYGWMWMPGYDWAPAWVIWGDYDDYYGWACLGPGDILSPHFRPDARRWHFVNHQYMGRPDFRGHIMRSDDIAHGVDINARVNVIAHANTYGQSVFFRGPDASEVERYSGQKVTAAKINTVREPGQTKVAGNQVNIYRPAIARSNQQHAVPAKVTNAQPAHNNDRQNSNARPERTNTQQQRTNPQPQRTNTEAPRQYNPTPPRQNSPQPQRQYSEPSQPQRTFVPSARPAPTYSAPSRSTGGFNGGGGGGNRGGGGGRR